MKTIRNRTEELRQIAAQAREALQAGSCDFDNKAEVRAFEKHTETVFKNRISLIKGYENGGAAAESLTYYRLQRRIGAVLSYTEKNYGALRQKYPRLDIGNAIAELSAPCPSASFDALNDRYYIENAAAVFILDQLRSSGRLDEALEFLPESREELERIDMPNISDSVHSDDLIRGMLYVIRYRNLGLRGFDESKAFMDDADAAKIAEAAEAPVGRSRFEAIIRLLDQAVVAETAESLKAQTDSLAENLLLILDRLQSKKAALTETKLSMIGDEIKRISQTADTDDGQNAPSFEMTRTVAGDRQSNALAVEEELQKTDFQISSFCMSVLMLTPERRHEVRELLGSELFGLIKIPEAPDPYAMCFGFLYLLDSDSDHIWLYNFPYLILDAACRELPWAGTAQESAPEFSPALYEAAKLHPEKYITPPSESVLKRRIVDPPFVDPLREKITFSQLVYIMSGLAPPRGLPELSYMKALLQDSGLSKDEIDVLYEYLSLAYLIVKRDENYVFVDEDEDETGEDETGADDNAEELRELKRENKNLKAMISKLERRLRESGEALKNADESLNEASAELAELRSMIRKADKEQEDYAVTVSFPYNAKKRAVVFGGHMTWLKAIRPLLPNVRFIEPNAPVNTGLILSADVVWIQTNALSHSSFYKIIDVVRKHDVELHYFKYASAEKCAEQLALAESGEAENEANDSVGG